jgi:cysteinyl-tRNA synthetase
LKLFFLSAHYSNPVDYTQARIEEAKKEYERIEILMHKLDAMFKTRVLSDVIKSGTGAEIVNFRNKFIEYMDDDFNMPRALSVLFEMTNRCNILIESNEPLKNQILSYAMDAIIEMAGILGLEFLKDIPTVISDSEIEFKKSARLALKKAGKFNEADKIRKELEAKGIVLEDTKDDTTWRRKL